MRIVTWNMGRSKATHEAAWNYLCADLKPDIACIQEALSSVDRLSTAFGRITWHKTKTGGTGVFVRHGLAATAIKASLRGSYVAGVRVACVNSSIAVFSVHVRPESWGNQEAFESWLVNTVQAEPTVVGGDINTSRAYSAKHKAYLERLIERGVHDCHWAIHHREVPSFWGRQSSVIKYQDDHMFASQALAGAVMSCWVEDNPDTRLLSDHGPVIVELNLPPTALSTR